MSDASKLFPYLRQNLNRDEVGYLDLHARRFHYTLQLVQQCLARRPAGKQPLQVMDVGPHFLTMILRHDTAAKVNQLGFVDSYGPAQPRSGEEHFVFNLDHTVNRAVWPKVPPQDVIVAAEVVEHLHTSPNHWLPFFKSCLTPGGYLIVTTPNGVSLKRRLMMLAGVHPYELIRDDPNIPGHFREYTKTELANYGQAHGLRLVEFSCKAHLDYTETSGRVYNRLTAALPPSLRDTMYLVYQDERPSKA